MNRMVAGILPLLLIHHFFFAGLLGCRQVTNRDVVACSGLPGAAVAPVILIGNGQGHFIPARLFNIKIYLI